MRVLLMMFWFAAPAPVSKVRKRKYESPALSITIESGLATSNVAVYGVTNVFITEGLMCILAIRK